MFEADSQTENFEVVFCSTNRKNNYKDLEAKIDKVHLGCMWNVALKGKLTE